MRRFAAVALLALFGATSARGITPEQESLRKGAVAKLFELEFVESRAQMRRLMNTDPLNPLGYLFEAGIIWWQASAEYGLFKDTPTLQGLFEADVEDCLSRSKPYLESSDAKARQDGMFAAGMCYGVKGQWDLSRGRYLRAYRDGKKANKLLKKLVKENPEYYDAYLGLGIFDYETDRLPAALRITALLFIRGDATRGKARIRDSIEKGRLVSRQAEMFLMSLLVTEEKDYAGALPMVDSLLKEYPASPYFHFVRMTLLHRLGQDEASYKEAFSLFERSAADPEILGRKQLAMICGLSGESCLQDSTLKEAAAWLDAALARCAAEQEKGRQSPENHPKTSTLAAWRSTLELYRGLAHDMLGEREPALERYRTALAPDAPAPISARAKSCLASSCTREAVTQALKEMSLMNSPVPRSAGPLPDAGRASSEQGED